VNASLTLIGFFKLRYLTLRSPDPFHLLLAHGAESLRVVGVGQLSQHVDLLERDLFVELRLVFL
jgi:hypothetical protein